MKKTPFLTAAALGLVFLVSCKNSTTGLPVPKDAAMVVHINSSSLTSKLSWNEIKQTNWFQELQKDADDSLAKKLMDNPDASGIDVKSPFVFFIKKQGNGGYVVFEGNLKDPSAFEAMNKKIDHDSATQQDGDMKYMRTEGSSIVSWNGTKFIYMSDAPGINPMGKYTASGSQEQGFSIDSLKMFSKQLFELKSNNSIETDDHFASLIKESGDVHFWINTEQLTSSMGGGMFSMLKMNSLFQGNVSAATLSFDDGKITVKSKQYYGPEMAKIMEKYESKPISKDVINRIPSQNVVGAMVMNYPPEAAKEFLKTAGLDGMANAFLGKFNYSLDELLQATKGQMVFAVTDFSVNKVPKTIEGSNYTYTATEPSANYLIALSVNNKASFDKLTGIAMNQFHDAVAQSKIDFKTTNEWFALSNHPETVDKFLAGGNNNVPFADKLSGHPFGLYIDIQKIIKGTQSVSTDSSSMEAMDASLKMWQDVVATGGEYKNGRATSEIVINLVDKSTNSLKQINQYIEKMYAAKKKNEVAVTNPDPNSKAIFTPPVVVDSSAAPH